MPNVLIIGAQRSGTTTLYRYLRAHPQVYMSPIKEPAYFALDSESKRFLTARGVPIDEPFGERSAYERLFDAVDGEQAIGEASTLYLFSRHAARNIRDTVPDVRLIVILRNPIERAYSAFHSMVRDGQETTACFAEALRREAGRRERNCSPAYFYGERGMYGEQLARYLKAFDREQILILLYEDLEKSPGDVARRIYTFLAVDADFVPDTSTRHNASGVPRNEIVRTLRALAAGTNPVKAALRPFFSPIVRRRLSGGVQALVGELGLRAPPPLDDEIRSELVERFRLDVGRLQDMVERDLSHWLDRGSGRHGVS